MDCMAENLRFNFKRKRAEGNTLTFRKFKITNKNQLYTG